MARTYYEVLGVPDGASDAEITAAYREKVKETHPDLSEREDARKHFRRVVRAEEVLTDPVERARYDRLGHDEYVRAENGLWPGDMGPESAADAGGGSAPGKAAGGPNTGRTSRTRTGERGPGNTASDGPFDWTGTARTGGMGADGPTGARASAGGATAGADGVDWTVGEDPWEAVDREAAWRQAREQARSQVDAEDWTGSPYDRSAYINSTRFEWADEGVGQLIDTQQSLLLFVVMLILYPIFLFSSVTPLFPVAVNAVVALCTAGSVVYMLTRPRIALPFFGSFSLFAPIVLVTLDVSLLSLTGLYVLGATWIPFIYALLIGWVLVH